MEIPEDVTNIAGQSQTRTATSDLRIFLMLRGIPIVSDVTRKLPIGIRLLRFRITCLTTSIKLPSGHGTFLYKFIVIYVYIFCDIDAYGYSVCCFYTNCVVFCMFVIKHLHQSVSSLYFSPAKDTGCRLHRYCTDLLVARSQLGFWFLGYRLDNRFNHSSHGCAALLNCNSNLQYN